MMQYILSQDDDFRYCKSILEEFYDHEQGFHMMYLPKFWCNFAWVENYWNDVKRVTREQCDFTLPNLKRAFTLALQSACPPSFLRNYMRKCVEHVDVVRRIGRDGNFSVYDRLVKEQKAHRNTQLIRLGTMSEPRIRDRDDWGSLQHARLKNVS